MAQTILDQLLNSCVRNIECGLIHDYDPLQRYADLFAGIRGILQELGVNDDRGSPSKPELIDKLFDGVCRI